MNETSSKKLVFEEDNLPKGWIKIKLENICTKITDGSHNSPPNSSIGEIPYVTAKNIRPQKLDFTIFMWSKSVNKKKTKKTKKLLKGLHVRVCLFFSASIIKSRTLTV